MKLRPNTIDLESLAKLRISAMARGKTEVIPIGVG